MRKPRKLESHVFEVFPFFFHFCSHEIKIKIPVVRMAEQPQVYYPPPLAHQSPPYYPSSEFYCPPGPGGTAPGWNQPAAVPLPGSPATQNYYHDQQEAEAAAQAKKDQKKKKKKTKAKKKFLGKLFSSIVQIVSSQG